jgi:septum formation inhibitor-activating ATPase MinD
MVLISRAAINRHLNRAAAAATTKGQGQALEDLVCYIFGKIPGITVRKRNPLNVFRTQEIDVAVWNDKSLKGLPFLPYIILIECKNWNTPVSSNEVEWFLHKLRSRGLVFGILIAYNGITGDAADLTCAHSIIADALREQRNIVIVTRSEIASFRDSSKIVKLVKEKLCEQAVTGTAFP